jgi:hypothetical protein
MKLKVAPAPPMVCDWKAENCNLKFVCDINFESWKFGLYLLFEFWLWNLLEI